MRIEIGEFPRCLDTEYKSSRENCRLPKNRRISQCYYWGSTTQLIQDIGCNHWYDQNIIWINSVYRKNSVTAVQVTTVTDMDRLAKITDTKLKRRGRKCGFSF